MRGIRVAPARWAGCLFVAGLTWVAATDAVAHCDTLDGPVVMDAREALASGDVTPVLKWVRQEHEGEVRNAFANTMAVRRGGADAGRLADLHFFETVVRIHRDGEGAPYTGLKNEPVDPVIAMAEAALGMGSADDMLAKLKAHMELVLDGKFARVMDTAGEKDQSVEAGRAYVEAYVTYMHYVEALHAAIVSSGAHAHDGPAGPSGHED